MTLSALFLILLDGYAPCSVLLLAGLLIFPKHRKLLTSLRTGANMLLVLGGTWLLVFTVWMLFRIPFGDEREAFALANRMSGPYGYFFWGALACKGLFPQVFWLRRFRRSIRVTAVVLCGQLLGLSAPLLLLLPRDYLPSSWAMLPYYMGILKSSAFFILLLTISYCLWSWQKPNLKTY
jgi:molybdopterin-containing oxidoreductase family membrane subunit